MGAVAREHREEAAPPLPVLPAYASGLSVKFTSTEALSLLPA